MRWYTTVLLFLTIVALMVVNSSEFFFHQQFYEINDWAANSISVNRAKHFSELYGNYSRWGFHHPGPAFFYLYALGEWALYDKLHLVAAPFNGQLFAHLVLMTGYFVAILAVFSRWLPRGGRPWFLPVALVVSALHFSAMANLAPDLYYTLHAPSAIASPWSAHALVMPILCLLTVGASVAAGKGQYLPLLAFTDGCLIHTHVAQPLFVFPLTTLAYAGLCWEGWRHRRLPWWEFARAHTIAFAILAVFALPIVGDLFLGTDSNFALILDHLRAHRGEHKPLARSIVYFLQFGSYTEYNANRNDFGHYDVHGLLVYLGRHALYYLMWLAALALALRPLVLFFRRRNTSEAAGEVAAPDSQRFLAWGGVFLIVGFGLTLFWGVIQDGPMTYFNAWFNYSFYHFTALLALAALCAQARPEARVRWWEMPAGAVLVVGVCLLLAEPLRVYDPFVDADRATRARVNQAIEDSSVPGKPPVTKLLLFTQETWEMAAGLALHLDRKGLPFVVPPQWAVVVGKEHLWSDFPANTSLENMQMYRLHARHTDTAKQPAYALPKVSAALTTVPLVIDPADKDRSTIEFRPKGNNFLAYQVIGWSATEKWGTWNDGKIAILTFHPKSADGSDVQMIMNVLPMLRPQIGLNEQIIRVFFNGEQVESERTFSQEDPAMTFTIPSALWEHAASEPADVPTTLEFRFPNAAPPALVNPQDPAGDFRLLAVGFRQIQFRKADQASEPLDETHPAASTQEKVPAPSEETKPALPANENIPPAPTGKTPPAKPMSTPRPHHPGKRKTLE